MRGKVIFKGEPEDDEVEGEERDKDEEVHIKVLDDKDAEIIALPLTSAMFAPSQTYTDDWDWRHSLE